MTVQERIVLACSGSPDTLVAIPWLAERYGAEVVTVTVDLGQSGRELGEVRSRALAGGAVRAHVIDGREEFARDHVLPALQAGALCQEGRPLATLLARPFIGRKLVEVAAMEGAAAIAHGATGGDEARIAATARALDPDIRVIAFRRDWGMTRPEAAAYARARGVVVPATAGSPCRVDAAPDLPACVELSFEQGVPVAINGVPMGLVELVENLAIIAGQHGVGRIALAEDRQSGVSPRGICEAPAAVVLHAAHQALERLVLPRDLDRVKRGLSVTYADLVYNGLWLTPMREALDAFNSKVQEKVTGVICVKLFKGQHTVVGRTSPHADDRGAAAGSTRVFGRPAETAVGAARPRAVASA